MQIVVGSTNPVKLKAVRVVMERIYPAATIEGMTAPSGVPHQPWGDAETRQGAYNRAQAVLQMTNADLGIGLEGGVQENEFGLFTCAWCVVVSRNGQVGVGGSACTQLPQSVAEQLRHGDELGVAMDTLSGLQNVKHNDGAIGLLTNGLLSRQMAYEQIIIMAFAPFLRPEWFQKGVF